MTDATNNTGFKIISGMEKKVKKTKKVIVEKDNTPIYKKRDKNKKKNSLNKVDSYTDGSHSTPDNPKGGFNSINKVVDAFRPEIRSIISNSSIKKTKMTSDSIEIYLEDGHKIIAYPRITTKNVFTKGKGGKPTEDVKKVSDVKHRYMIYNPDKKLILDAVR